MSDLIQNFTEKNFKKTIEKSIVLVDFFAVWCAPCRMLSPILEQIAEGYKGKIVVGKVDIDAEQEIASKYKVSSVPTVILFKGGKEFNRLVGLRDFAALKDFVDAAL